MAEEPESGVTAVETPQDDYVLHSETEAEKPAVKPEAPEGDKPEDTDSEVRKKPGGYVKKLNQREAELAQERAEKAQLIAELERYRSGTPKAEKVEAKDGEPTENDFESYGEYIKAWTKWDSREALKQFQAEQTTRQQDAQKEQAHESKILTYQAKVDALAEADPTYNPEVYDQKLLEVMQKGLVTQAMEDEVLDADNSERITRHLLDHPEELLILRNMDEKSLSRAIAKLDARFDNQGQSVKAAVRTTKAPPPISPVKSNSSGNTKELDELPYDEYKAVMDKKDRESRR